MFGDNPLLFQTTIKKPKNNRIVIPAKTDVEAGESLILYNKDVYLSIYSLRVYEKIIEDYKKLKKKAQSEGNFLLAEKINFKLQYIYMHIYDSVIVDGNNRIVLSKKVMDDFSFSGNIYVLGEYDHISLFPSENRFENYKKYVKEKRS